MNLSIPLPSRHHIMWAYLSHVPRPVQLPSLVLMERCAVSDEMRSGLGYPERLWILES